MKRVIFIIGFVATMMFATATVRYVKVGGTGNGSSWALASGDLQFVINNSNAGDTVFVAKGTYVPIRRADSATYNSVYTPNNEDNAFLLKQDVYILGGFAGNETSASQRNWAKNPTILDGKLGECVYAHRVVLVAGSSCLGTLDGFILQKSPSDMQCASNGSPDITVNGENISSDWYSGITVCHSNPLLYNLIVQDCGTGICIANNSSPEIVNILIHSNTNGGIQCYKSSPSIYNSTITKNSVFASSPYAHAIYNENSYPKFYNTIVYGNISTNLVPGVEVKNVNSTPQYYYSLVAGETTKSNGCISGNTDPLFANPAANDFSLYWGSPCIDKGHSGYVLADKDLACNQRIIRLYTDMGAYEHAIGKTNAKILFVRQQASGNNSGETWKNAIPNLSDALQIARINPSVEEIWIAGGTTYYPDHIRLTHIDHTITDPKEKGFLLTNGVSLYAGFPTFANDVANAPSASLTRDQARNTRNWKAYPTILDGNNSSAHIFLAINCQDTVTIDGFTITGGNANSFSTRNIDGYDIDHLNGGGITAYASNLKLKNAIIQKNKAVNNGGAIYCDSGFLFMENVTIDSNTSTMNKGGGIYAKHAFLDFNKVDISGNYAGNGGGLYLFASFAKGVKANIFGNSASLGGGAYLDSASFLFNFNIFQNLAKTNGGGVFNNIKRTDAIPILENIAITNNTAIGASTYAGRGGGIYNNFSKNDTIKFVNLTIASNKSFDKTGTPTEEGIYNNGAAYTMRVYNSVIAYNSTHTADYNPIYNKYYYSTYTENQLQPSDSGNLLLYGATVGFRDTATGNYRLRYNSPLVNKGTDTCLSPYNTHDPDGNPRIVNNIVDIGAYESFIQIEPDTAGVLYVNKHVVGGDKSGRDWSNAMPELADALLFAKHNKQIVNQIWVAKGNYKPLYIAADNGSNDDKHKSFVIPEGIEVYGGFAGWETDINQRKIKDNETTLNGKLNNSTNVYHVVIFSDMGSVEDMFANPLKFIETRLDGFTIINGAAAGTGSITVNGGTIYDNCGGGVYNRVNCCDAYNVGAGQGLTIDHCIIRDNQASEDGGGIYNTGGNAINIFETYNSLIYNNTAKFGGGIFSDNNVDFYIEGSTIVNNTANFGSGIYGLMFIDIRGCIITGNTGNMGTTKNFDFPQNTGYTTVQFSLIKDETVLWQYDKLINYLRTNNLNGHDNPLFVNPSAGDFRLKFDSPCLNRGYASRSGVMDLDGKPRYGQYCPDMGCYERTVQPDSTGIVYVNQHVTGGDNTGSSWHNAIPELAFPMIAALYDSTIRKIYVAEGTYLPNRYHLDNYDPVYNLYPNTLNPYPIAANSFFLPKKVQILGGFSSSDTTLSSRDWMKNRTRLSGDLDRNGTTNLGDATHVVLSINNDSTSVLDGFFVSGGAPRLSPPNLLYSYNMFGLPHLLAAGFTIDETSGGGIYNLLSQATYRNLQIEKNRKESRGGGMFNDTSSPRLYNVNIIGNEALNGLGMYNLYSHPHIVGGRIDSNQTNPNLLCNGAGIYNYSSNPLLSGVTIRGNNVSNGKGGGMYNDWSNPKIDSCVFAENSAKFGGGMYNFSSKPVLSNSTLSGNQAPSGCGGGIYNFASNALLSSVTIQKNTAANGGGLYNNQSSPKLDTVLIDSNIVTDNGGGMYNEQNSSPTFANTKFTKNRATNGGGIFNITSTVNPLFELSGLSIENNTAISQGGGIFMANNGGMNIYNVKIIGNFAIQGGGIFNQQAPFNLINVLLAENRSSHGGAVYSNAGNCDMTNVTVSRNQNDNCNIQTIFSNNQINIYNSIIYNNMIGVTKPNPTIRYYYSLVQNITTPGAPYYNLSGTLNPQFINPASGIYQLSTSPLSPCINAGDSNYYLQARKITHLANEKDLAGNPRRDDKNIDLGAYEQCLKTPYQKSIYNNEDQLVQKDPPLEEAIHRQLNVYPNPTTGQLRITNYGSTTLTDQNRTLSGAEVEIYDIYGKKHVSHFTFHNSHIEIDISHLANGMYFLKVDGKMMKVVKE